MASIGVEFKVKSLELNEKKVKMLIVSYSIIVLFLILQWDTAGQERFRSITTSYYRSANCIGIVYDITESETFEHIKVWLEEISKYAKENVLKILIGNKSDLDQQRAVKYEQGQELADRYGIPFIETSAKADVCINKLFEQAASNYIDKLENTNVSAIDDKKFYFPHKELMNGNDNKIISISNKRKKNSLLINPDKRNDDSNCCK